MKQFIVLIMVLSICLVNGQDRVTGKNFATRSEVIAQNGMAATSQPLATQTALEILKRGGNAVDAAIAANAVLGIVEPMSCGIGGDLCALIWDAKTRKLHGINASGRSPQSLSYTTLVSKLKKEKRRKIPTHGALPLSVPGCVDGWYEMHAKFGSLPMDQILEPAVHYADAGFPVSEIIAFIWQDIVQYIRDQPGFKETFLINGMAPKKGEVFKNPNLAETLRKIAQGGRDVFYKGEIAHKLTAFIKEHGGFVTFEDLAAHTSQWVDPVSTNYRGYDIWEFPPNGQGLAVLQMLNILEKYNIKKMGFGNPRYLHILIEAKKLAFEDRAKFYTDPAFNKVPVEILISKKYAKERRKLINNKRAALSYDAGEIETGNTVYLTVADKEGNIVSLIQSINWEFGSGMVPTELGFALQNRGELFSLEPGHANVYQPGKQPFHTIIPAFITRDGKPYISFGVMGGSMQPQGHVQIINNIIDFGMNLQVAGDAPRIRHIGASQPTGGKMIDGGIVNMESGFPFETTGQLVKRGHKVRYYVGGYGGYQAIRYDTENQVYYGASESRKDGLAAGY